MVVIDVQARRRADPIRVGSFATDGTDATLIGEQLVVPLYRQAVPLEVLNS